MKIIELFKSKVGTYAKANGVKELVMRYSVKQTAGSVTDAYPVIWYLYYRNVPGWATITNNEELCYLVEHFSGVVDFGLTKRWTESKTKVIRNTSTFKFNKNNFDKRVERIALCLKLRNDHYLKIKNSDHSGVQYGGDQ